MSRSQAASTTTVIFALVARPYRAASAVIRGAMSSRDMSPRDMDPRDKGWDDTGGAGPTHAEPSAVYVGTVTHKRLRPVEHRLSYGVFTLLVDLDALPRLHKTSWLIAHNGLAPLAIYDRDFCDRSGGTLRPQIEALAAQVGVDLVGGRILMLCYPRVFGFVFNPITVYFCEDRIGRLACLVYEVSNTFGDRHSYVLPVEPGAVQGAAAPSVFQACDKGMFVSPFNPLAGSYTFHVAPPADRVAVGVMLRDADGPKLKALFTGRRRPLTSGVLAGRLLAMPFLTLKVVAAIHWEAAKLWWKRLPLLNKPPGPRLAASTRDAGGTTRPLTPTHHPSPEPFQGLPASASRSAASIPTVQQ